jgi:hypothetical protein
MRTAARNADIKIVRVQKLLLPVGLKQAGFQRQPHALMQKGTPVLLAKVKPDILCPLVLQEGVFQIDEGKKVS